jgi:hypothetical protein
MGSAAVGGDAGVLGEGAAAVESELDACRRGLELDVLAAEASRDVQAVVDVEALLALTSSTPSSSTRSSIWRVASPLSFFEEVATFQIVPSGACTTAPYPQKLFFAGFSVVAPASRAVPMRLSTVLG